MKTKRSLGISAQLLIGFSAFTIIIVSLLWIFQITLLNTFYKFIKETEVKTTAHSVINNINQDDEELTELLIEIAKSTGIDIMITNSAGTNIINVSSMHSDLFYKLDENICKALFIKVSDAGGELLINTDHPGNALGINNTDQGKKFKSENTSFLYLRTVTSKDGTGRLLIFKTQITPIDSTVNTLKIQLGCLTVVMLLLSLILAFTISKKISKPIVSINESAKELGKGNYNITFTEKGSREVRELSSTLNYASHELSKVENLRRELIANVSHDLRTPLTMITGFSEVMRDIPGENTPENVQIIIDEANRLTQLVNDMLDISKIESGTWELNRSRVNITESIENILLRFDKLSQYKIEFLHGDDAYVDADELKISQVIYNLVNNAITHTGGENKVTIRQSYVYGRVKIEVIDTGEGIPQDKIKDIWERYYKVDKEHKRSAIGTGLGLSIVKKILDLHGGEYGVVSTEGVGSNFWFSLNLYK